MSEEHPLSLVEQVTPIINLMARTSTHFARLRDFIQLRFPPGFPVKIGKARAAVLTTAVNPKQLGLESCCIHTSRLVELFHI